MNYQESLIHHLEEEDVVDRTKDVTSDYTIPGKYFNLSLKWFYVLLNKNNALLDDSHSVGTLFGN